MNLEAIAQAVRITGCAWNGGAGGEYIIVGSHVQLEALANKLTEVQAARIAALEEELRIDEKLLQHRSALLAMIPPCPEHGEGCVPFAVEWIGRMKEKPTDAMWVASFERRGQVEEMMFAAARGKRPMPTPQELREWGLKLGTVHEHIALARANQPKEEVK